ncbi:hypothetical protein TCON_0940 [Astathelohania contejeani]|uniref:Uncharacterized protein n=1 Tax=Astathelohania contejeani TaxID=164912 RepID=A0ABQ7I067_9MICR|nr:hypothetical protein TCON_0940 [Thelohania contejeani]
MNRDYRNRSGEMPGEKRRRVFPLITSKIIPQSSPYSENYNNLMTNTCLSNTNYCGRMTHANELIKYNTGYAPDIYRSYSNISPAKNARTRYANQPMHTFRNIRTTPSYNFIDGYENISNKATDSRIASTNYNTKNGNSQYLTKNYDHRNLNNSENLFQKDQEVDERVIEAALGLIQLSKQPYEKFQ